MRTCKDCEKFLKCLRNGDVVVNVRCGDHICEKFIAISNSNKQTAQEVTRENKNT